MSMNINKGQIVAITVRANTIRDETTGEASIKVVQEQPSPGQRKDVELTFGIETRVGQAWLDSCRESLRHKTPLDMACTDSQPHKIIWIIESAR